MVVGTIFGVLATLIGLGIILSGFKVIRPVEKGLVETFGKYSRTEGPGLKYIIPFVQRLIRVDVTENMADVKTQKIITKDDLNAEVDAVVYYRVLDPKDAEYEVADYEMQIISLAQTTLRNIIGGLTLSDANTKRAKINGDLERELTEQIKGWGLKIVRVEMQRIDPPSDVQSAMNDVVTAERKKMAAKDLANAEEIEADGLKRAAIKKAEGRRQAKILEAEGAKKARILAAEAEKQGIELINETLSKSPDYVDWLKADRWDGKLPQVTGGSIPMIDLTGAGEKE